MPEEIYEVIKNIIDGEGTIKEKTNRISGLGSNLYVKKQIPIETATKIIAISKIVKRIEKAKEVYQDFGINVTIKPNDEENNNKDKDFISEREEYFLYIKKKIIDTDLSPKDKAYQIRKLSEDLSQKGIIKTDTALFLNIVADNIIKFELAKEEYSKLGIKVDIEYKENNNEKEKMPKRHN